MFEGNARNNHGKANVQALLEEVDTVGGEAPEDVVKMSNAAQRQANAVKV